MSALTRPSATVSPIRTVLVPQTFDQLVTFAEMAAQSELMPKDYRGKPANIMIAVQMGSELGLAPMQALNSIAVINGRPGVWGDGLIGLCRQSPLCEDIQERIEGEGDARMAVCVAKRRDASPSTGRFSVADAKRAGLFGKAGPWTQYPDRMLQNRARGFALRDAFPDLLRGLKTVEELRDTPVDDFRGTTLDAQPEPLRQPSRPRDAVDADTIPALDEVPADLARRWVDNFKVAVAAVQTDNALQALLSKTATQNNRDNLRDHRSDLSGEVETAIEAAVARLRPPPQQEAPPAPNPSDDHVPF